MAVAEGCIPDAAGGRALEAVLGGLPMGAVLLDHDLRCRFANELLARLDGLPLEHHLGRRLEQLLPAAGDDLSRAARRAMTCGTVVDSAASTAIAASGVGDQGLCARWIPVPGGVLGLFSEATPATSTATPEVASVLERARLYEQEHQVAEVLQRALLPDRLAAPDGLELAARYVPGTEGVAVGGDWYDVFDLGANRVGIAVGDVVGKGVAAAAVMGRLRNALRAHATTVDAPAEVLARVDDFALRFGSDDLATVLYGVLDVGTGELRLSSAGHLPPLLTTADGAATLLRFEPGVPVGVTDAGVRPEHRIRLEEGSTLVLYSDGLVEDRTRPLDHGLAHLTRAAPSVVGNDVEAACDALIAELVGDGGDDDLALLVVRWRGTSAGDRVSVLLGADVGSPARARLLVDEQLAAWAREDMGEVARLCVSELVTNAVLHARTDVQLTMIRGERSIRFEVADRETAPPERVDAAVDALHGRGVALVETVAAAWGVEAAADGKSVWFELTT